MQRSNFVGGRDFSTPERTSYEYYMYCCSARCYDYILLLLLQSQLPARTKPRNLICSRNEIRVIGVIRERSVLIT